MKNHKVFKLYYSRQHKMKRQRITRILELYLSSVLIYCLGIFLFKYFPYYQKILHPQTQQALLYLYLGYLILAPFLYLIFAKEDSENKPYLVLKGLKKVFIKLFALFKKRNIKWSERKSLEHELNYQKPKLLKKEKVAFLFILVKLFYLPLMINFFYNNFNHLFYLKDQLMVNPLNSLWYPLIVTSVFAIDTGVFAIGYAFESKKLKNVVKSVEPTFFGWFVAIVCYPPFNIWVGNYIPWGANDYVLFSTPLTTVLARLAVVFFLVIYVWATIALGFKASNLTNRGIVTKFPYSIIRHPAYISKNMIWWLTLLPLLNWKFALGMFFWSVIYFFRTTTEEKHLSKDPDYIAYKKKVKWRLVPGVY